MTAPEPSVQPRLAAIDVGSNTIRLTVAEVQDDDSYRILDEEREMVRLGEKLDRTGRLSEAAIERALAAIGKMKAIADGFKTTELRAIATSAVREASNGRGFIREVSRQHKVRVDVISGEEEAQLAFRSATRHFDHPGALDRRGRHRWWQRRGDSLRRYRRRSCLLSAPRRGPSHRAAGSVRPLKPKHWKQMKEEIDRGIRTIMRRPAHRAEIMIGSGGTFTALAHMSK